MKKGSPVLEIRIADMVNDGLVMDEQSVKLALQGPRPNVETASVDKIKTYRQGIRLLKKAKSVERKFAIARKIVPICETLEELEQIECLIPPGRTSVINNGLAFQYNFTNLYIETYRTIFHRMVLATQMSFKELFALWWDVAYDNPILLNNWVGLIPRLRLTIADYNAREVIKELIERDLWDDWDETDPGHAYPIVWHVAHVVSPETAKQILIDLQNHISDYNTEWVRVLIRKASTLYQK